MNGEQIITCRSGCGLLEYRRQLIDELLPRLCCWLKGERAVVAKAFLTVRNGRLLFLVVRKQVKCDLDFTDRLTDLDAEIANDPELDQINMDVLALPNVSGPEALT